MGVGGLPLKLQGQVIAETAPNAVTRAQAGDALTAPDTLDEHGDVEPGPRRRSRRIVIALDVIAVAFGLLIGAIALHLRIGIGTEPPAGRIGARALLFLPIYILAFSAYGLYRRDRRRLFPTSFPDLAYIFHALIAASAGTIAASHLLHRISASAPRLSVTGVIVLTVPNLLTVPVVRLAGGAAVKMGHMVRSRVVILGSGVVADSVARKLGCFDDIELVGHVDAVGSYADVTAAAASAAHGETVSATPYLGRIEDLAAICERLDADRVIVAFSPTAAPELADTLRRLPSKVQISVVPRLFDLLTWRSSVDELHGLPLMDVAPPILNRAHAAWKRALDLTVALGGIVLALPAWVAIAIAIKVTSPGPVLFKQVRSGRFGAPFYIYKFRTMRMGAEEERGALEQANEVDGPLFKIKADPRVTKIGRFLRATSLDEVPQLLNVVKGDMSLVGPRPFVVHEADRIDGWAARRFDVRPGMTGLWQVSGRNEVPYDELRRLDYQYVASWSAWWDLKIIWQTPSSVLRRRGAS